MEGKHIKLVLVKLEETGSGEEFGMYCHVFSD
jgi:hypothetical protein